MKTTKWILAMLSVGVLGVVLVQWQAAAGLKSANEQLRTEQAGTAEAPPLIQADQGEAARLREENRDLLKLRNEVRQLREQVKDQGKVRAEHERLQKALATGSAPGQAKLPTPEGFIARETLADVGTGTPAAAVQTFLWSMREGNLEKLLQTVSPRFMEQHLHNLSPEQADEYNQRLVVLMQQQMKSFSNFRVVGQEQKGPDKVMLQLQSSAGSKVAKMTVRLYGNEWRVEDPF
jgi:hypothetical protein